MRPAVISASAQEPARSFANVLRVLPEHAPSFSTTFRAELRELVRWRRDVRRFRREPLPDGLLDELLHEVGATSASVGLSQPWRFVVVDDERRRERVRANFASANAQALQGYDGERARGYASLKLAGLDDAPVHLAAFVDPDTGLGAGLGRRTMPETLAYSVVAAVQTFWLLARAEGIGVGWVSILDPAPINGDLGVPPAWRLVAYLCVGRAEAESRQPELEKAGWEHRRPPAEFVFHR